MSDFIIAEAEEVGDVQHVPDHDVPLSAEQLSSFIDDTAEKDDSHDEPIVRRQLDGIKSCICVAYSLELSVARWQAESMVVRGELAGPGRVTSL